MRSLIERLACATCLPVATFEKLHFLGMDTVESLYSWAKSYREVNYPNRLYTGRTREEALGHMMFEMLDPANAGRFA